MCNSQKIKQTIECLSSKQKSELIDPISFSEWIHQSFNRLINEILEIPNLKDDKRNFYKNLTEKIEFNNRNEITRILRTFYILKRREEKLNKRNWLNEQINNQDLDLSANYFITALNIWNDLNNSF